MVLALYLLGSRATSNTRRIAPQLAAGVVDGAGDGLDGAVTSEDGLAVSVVAAGADSVGVLGGTAEVDDERESVL